MPAKGLRLPTLPGQAAIETHDLEAAAHRQAHSRSISAAATATAAAAAGSGKLTTAKSQTAKAKQLRRPSLHFAHRHKTWWSRQLDSATLSTSNRNRLQRLPRPVKPWMGQNYRDEAAVKAVKVEKSQSAKAKQRKRPSSHLALRRKQQEQQRQELQQGQEESQPQPAKAKQLRPWLRRPSLHLALPHNTWWNRQLGSATLSTSNRNRLQRSRLVQFKTRTMDQNCEGEIQFGVQSSSQFRVHSTATTVTVEPQPDQQQVGRPNLPEPFAAVDQPTAAIAVAAVAVAAAAVPLAARAPVHLHAHERRPSVGRC